MDPSEQITPEKVAQCLDISITDQAKRKQNESLFQKFKQQPQFGTILLTIASNVNKAYPAEIELNAAIQLKNFINQNWKFTQDHNANKTLVFDEDETIIIIPKEDKDFIRNNIIDAMFYCVSTDNTKVLKQFSQCIKRILKQDYPNYKSAIIQKLLEFYSGGDDKKIYAGIVLHHQISKLYEFETSEEQKLYNDDVLVKVNPYLLSFMSKLTDLTQNVQALFAYKIIKIYFKSFQGAIPMLYTQESVFDAYMQFLYRIIDTPVPTQENAEFSNKNNIFWKVKHTAYSIIARVVQKYTSIAGDGLGNFKEMLLTKYLQQYFEKFFHYYSMDNNTNFIDLKCKNLIYNLFNQIIYKKYNSDQVILLLLNNQKLKEQLIKDAMLTEETIKEFFSDPKSYINKSLDEISNYLTLRYQVGRLVDNIMTYREKKKEKGKSKEKKKMPKYYEPMMTFLVDVIKEASSKLGPENQNLAQNGLKTISDVRYNLIKESAMYLIAQNSITVSKISPAIVDRLIIDYISCELNSPFDIMKEKTLQFITIFRNHSYENANIPSELTKKICEIISNEKNALPIRTSGAICASSMLNYPNTKELLRDSVKPLLGIYIKLIDETDLEDIVNSLQDIIRNFKNETTDYIVQLTEYLTKYFDKLTHIEGSDEKAIDTSQMISNLITTFIEIIHNFAKDTTIYSQIEPNINILIKYCLDDVYEKLDDGLDLISAILKNCEKFPKKLWEYFIPIVQTITGSEEEKLDHEKNFQNEPYEGVGFESLYDISKIISLYIIKDSEYFLNAVDEKNVRYVTHILGLVKNVVTVCEKKNNYVDLKFAFNIMITMLNVYRGKIDNIQKELLIYISKSFVKTKDEKYKSVLRMLLGACLVYNPTLAISTYEATNETKNILKFFYEGLNDSNRKNVKYNLMGLCCLLTVNPSQQTQLVLQNMQNLINRIVELATNEGNKRDKKENEEEDEFEECSDDEEEKEALYAKALKGEFDENEDEDISWEEGDEDEEDDKALLTEIDKQSEILFIRDTLNHISTMSSEYYNNILGLLGEANMQKLNEIFAKEEARIKNKENPKP